MPGGGNVNVVTDDDAESWGASADGWWAKLPSRCISRETSLESYVRYEAFLSISDSERIQMIK
jgi:hypothetical protein